MSASDDGIFILGNYKLIEVLGIGAMGYVYRARQVNLDRDVAVKILSPKLAQESGYLDLFFREARTAASLEHPHIVPVFDYGVQQNVSYVAMRLLLGGSLGDKLQYRLDRNQPLPSIPEVTSILMQAASALDYAHARGVIHRDIKPTNLMFDQHGVIYIVDFGIAKLIGTTSSIKGGTFLGTPSFMAPEQWEGLTPTPAVDQYALGAVVYMLLTGHPPFESETALALMSKHLKEIPKDVQQYRPGLSDQVNRVLQRAMAKLPDDRYPNVVTFAQEFAEVVQERAGEKTTGFMTYTLPQTSFALPFPTPTTIAAPPTAPVTVETHADPPSTLRLPAVQGRNLIVWVESGLLVLAVVLIVILLIQRSGTDPISPTVVIAAAAPSATVTLPDDPPVQATDADASIGLVQFQSTTTPTSTASATSTLTSTSTPTSSDTPSNTPTLTDTPSHTPTFTPTLTDTPSDTPTFTPTVTDMPTSAATAAVTAAATAAVTEGFTPSPSPTATVAARPNVPWRDGTPLKISNPNGAWLRSHASTYATQIATLAYNNLVTATGNYFFDGRQWWWQVRATWGAVGWVEQYSLVQQ